MFQTTFSPVSFGKSFMKIRSAVPENGCLMHFWWTEKNKKKQNKNKKNKKTNCKTYTHPPHRRLRKLAMKISDLTGASVGFPGRTGTPTKQPDTPRYIRQFSSITDQQLIKVLT